MENSDLKLETKKQKEEIFDLKASLDQLNKRFEVKSKELERLMDQLKKKEKLHEDKIGSMQSKLNLHFLSF